MSWLWKLLGAAVIVSHVVRVTPIVTVTNAYETFGGCLHRITCYEDRATRYSHEIELFHRPPH